MASFLARDPIPDLVLDADGQPSETLALWMERRLQSQLPFFEEHGWRCAADELRALASRARLASEA